MDRLSRCSHLCLPVRRPEATSGPPTVDSCVGELQLGAAAYITNQNQGAHSNKRIRHANARQKTLCGMWRQNLQGYWANRPCITFKRTGLLCYLQFEASCCCEGQR